VGCLGDETRREQAAAVFGASTTAAANDGMGLRRKWWEEVRRGGRIGGRALTRRVFTRRLQNQQGDALLERQESRQRRTLALDVSDYSISTHIPFPFICCAPEMALCALG
jgi:hypothetical protein